MSPFPAKLLTLCPADPIGGSAFCGGFIYLHMCLKYGVAPTSRSYKFTLAGAAVCIVTVCQGGGSANIFGSTVIEHGVAMIKAM